MPEDSKKNQDKKRNDPKEQRKPRNARTQASKADKKPEKMEESRFVPKVPQKPPVYEEPGPEFYKNLKRETDEILKITEEENSKYKKKEIQSNWSKYEMPIESYEDIEEHDVGADYEKLIAAPLSIGGHFQFKHEKSWDTNTGPSLYDKYFEINMDNLSLAVSTIPFYERNCVDESLFSETDMLSMNNRATKYKQKYYDDKSYSTYSLKESLSKNNVENEKIESNSVEKNVEASENIQLNRPVTEDDLDIMLEKTDISSSHSNKKTEDSKDKSVEREELKVKSIDIIDDLVYNIPETKQESVEKIDDLPIVKTDTTINSHDLMKVQTASKSNETKQKDIPVETKKNPVIESPEDLEKWLDDFLDG